MAVSRSLRFQVLRRDGHRCHYCGATAAEAKLTVDHVTPVALGGTDTADNLVAACEPCNGGKSATPADAALVAQVQDRDTQFQAAVTDLTQEDRERRWFAEAFLDAWDLGELPPGWRRTIDAYRQQGLASDVWDEIVSIARNKANLDDPFRYCCGIARNQVKKIQEQAARELGASSNPATSPALDALGQAAVDVWLRNWISDHETTPDSETVARFEESVAKVREFNVLEPDRLLATAALGGCEQKPTINESLGSFMEQERANIVIEWADAWCYLSDVGRLGGAPDDVFYSFVQGQVEELVNFGVPKDRIRQAAILAGYHRSTELHHGLRDQDLRHTGVLAWRQMAVDIWARSFFASSGRWPEPEERGACVNAIDAASRAFDVVYSDDLFAAANAAGAYQDPNISTCMPRGLSALAAAAVIPALALA
jgi:hypothetical protein